MFIKNNREDDINLFIKNLEGSFTISITESKNNRD